MLEVTSYSNVTCVKGTVNLKGIQLAVHTFLTDFMLVDTGPVSMLNQFIPFFRENVFDLVALTHHHEDHTGCAPWIQKNLKLPIYIDQLAVDECLNVSDYPPFRKDFWGEREAFRALPFHDRLQSRNETWKVISTPGHASDHVVLLNANTGMLFSGDLFVTSKPEAILPEESITTMISSLQTILSYDFLEMFCSHAGYIPDGKRALKRKLHYLENLKSDILDLSWNGLTAREIKEVLFPQAPALVTLSNNDWDSMYIIKNVLEEDV
ncbi:MBL fold metallo-hydrolase [Halalkalibacter alkalisediminis]|uniref:MBL fold metallo-hydrolase n=1 Tax=Halalkalibacter alkalisediminis TaxID=935616 RepID=A0ABV6NDW6_9BACI|nr:MBL fold metallo-hydrolase [Halalkalibacter alkalisediminis]